MKTKLLKQVALMSLLSLAIMGCKKNDNEPISKNDATLDAYNLKHKPPVQKFTKDASAAFTIEGKGGVIISFPAGSLLDENNEAASGSVNLTLIEIFNKKDVLMGGIDTESYGQLLETGGQIFVEAEQGGEKLSMNPDKAINVLFPRDPNQTTDNMILFVARPADQDDANSDFTWSAFNKNLPTTHDHYEFRLPELSWINIDRFINDGKPKTDITVDLDGSEVTGSVHVEFWVVFKNIKSAFKLSGGTNVGGNYANLLPIGEEITLAVLGSNDEGQMFLDSRDLTTEDNKTYTMTPRPVSQAVLDAFIDSLE